MLLASANFRIPNQDRPVHPTRPRLLPTRPPARPDQVIRRDGKAAQLMIVLTLLLWIVLAGPLLSWLMPGRPLIAGFLTFAVPASIVAFLIGHNRGWWD